jgi:hypothetical protein
MRVKSITIDDTLSPLVLPGIASLIFAARPDLSSLLTPIISLLGPRRELGRQAIDLPPEIHSFIARKSGFPGIM